MTRRVDEQKAFESSNVNAAAKFACGSGSELLLGFKRLGGASSLPFRRGSVTLFEDARSDILRLNKLI